MTNHHSSAALRVAVICATTLSAAHAVDFEYIKIAQSGDPLPGGAGTFRNIYDFDIEDSQIVFTANSAAATARSVFKFVNGAFTTVATTSTPIPSGTGNFSEFASVSISNGEVAFRGLNPSAASGIYVTRQGSLSRVADANYPLPSATNLYFGARQSGDLRTGVNSGLSAGNVAFGASNGTSIGVFLTKQDGSLVTIAGTDLPVSSVGPATIDGDGVAFVGSNAAGRGIFRYSIAGNSLSPMVAPGTSFPNGAVPALREVPAISGNSVAFNVETTLDNLQGIYIADAAGLRLVADGNTPVPGSTGTFSTGTTGLGFHGVTNSNGNVAFFGRRNAGGYGIYTTLGGTLAEVISSDDSLSGRAISTSAGATAAPPKIDGGNILFNVEFTDGTSGLYVAASEHHWTAPGGGAWGTAGNWSFGLAPRSVIPTYLDPANGGIITGPAGTTQLKSLNIGAAQSGLAEFRMQANSQINVANAVAITPRGRIEVNGVLVASAVDNSGVIAVAGTGQIAGPLTNRETGEVRVGVGQRLTVFDPLSSNAGAIDVTGGEMEFTGTLSNLASTGLITARDATLRFGHLTNSGAVALVAGTSDVYGDIVNTGSIAVSGGTGAGTQTAIFHGDVVQNGALTVSASGVTHSVAVFLGAFSGAGGITGGGDVFFEGDLRPGNSPASVTYSANISLAAGAGLTMELAGRALGTQYDHLTVNGDFHLGGTLAVDLLGGFAPVNGDRFDLFDFNPARLSGSFGTLDLPQLSPGLSWDTSQLSSTGELSVVPEPGSAILLGFGALALLRRSRHANVR